MPTFRLIEELNANPEPAYAEHHELRTLAAAQGRLADPADIPVVSEVIQRRGHRWCSAVLARYMPSAGLGGINVVEARMLRLADQRDLDPPLPERILADEAETEKAQREREERQARHRELEQTRWRESVQQCAVVITVRPNIHGRRGDAASDGPLRHVVPDQEAISRLKGRPRRHLAGRALCETPQRARPLRLGATTPAPATCQRCLAFMPVIQPATPPGLNIASGDRHADRNTAAVAALGEVAERITAIAILAGTEADHRGGAPEPTPLHHLAPGDRIIGFRHQDAREEFFGHGAVITLKHRPERTSTRPPGPGADSWRIAVKAVEPDDVVMGAVIYTWAPTALRLPRDADSCRQTW